MPSCFISCRNSPRERMTICFMLKCLLFCIKWWRWWITTTRTGTVLWYWRLHVQCCLCCITVKLKHKGSWVTAHFQGKISVVWEEGFSKTVILKSSERRWMFNCDVFILWWYISRTFILFFVRFFFNGCIEMGSKLKAEDLQKMNNNAINSSTHVILPHTLPIYSLSRHGTVHFCGKIPWATVVQSHWSTLKLTWNESLNPMCCVLLSPLQQPVKCSVFDNLIWKKKSWNIM